MESAAEAAAEAAEADAQLREEVAAKEADASRLLQRADPLRSLLPTDAVEELEEAIVVSRRLKT